jgi:hypothetical protein
VIRVDELGISRHCKMEGNIFVVSIWRMYDLAVFNVEYFFKPLNVYKGKVCLIIFMRHRISMLENFILV